MNNSLEILAESLDMKIDVLKRIEEYNRIQKEAFEADDVKMDDFDDAIDKKGELIEELERLDDGFETLYESVAEQLSQDKAKYAEQISQIQEKIAVITELHMTVQASEARNKKLIEDYFVAARHEVRDGRRGSKVAYDYYKNMSGMNISESRFMDEKN